MFRILSVLLTGFVLFAITTASPFAKSADTVDPLTQAKLDRLKQGLHGLQLSLERWSVDNSIGDDSYPDSVNQLVVTTDSQYPYAESGLYYNPFAPGEEGMPNARQVPFGDWTPVHAGNFSFLVKYNDAGESMGYLLVAYGPMQGESTIDMTDDDAPDGIIIALASGKAVGEGPGVYYDNGYPVKITWGGKVAVMGEPY